MMIEPPRVPPAARRYTRTPFAGEMPVGIQHAKTLLAHAFLSGLALAALACVPDGPQPPRPPEPREITKPDAFTIDKLVVAVDNPPLDRDGDGFFDTYAVTALLFPRPDEHPLAVWAEGELAFVMRDERGNEVASWRRTAEQLADARFRQLVGESYRFGLSLIDGPDRGPTPDADRLRPFRATLFATYIPPGGGGPRIEASSGLTVRIGPTGL